MKWIQSSTLVGIACGIGAAVGAPAVVAQDVAPLFEQVPAVLYETFNGTTSGFDDYFEMLVEKYTGTGGTPWAIYRENAKTSYRITVLPEGLESLLPIQRARGTSFQDFSEAQVALWNAGWGTRQVSVYNAAPAMSVVPDGFSIDDIRALPYNRTFVYYLKWDQAGAFRAALRERSALDREAGLGSNFILTAWNGGIGTQAQVVMVRISAESRAADAGPNSDARRAARTSYREEWGRLNQVMNDAAWRIERHDQTRIARLSYSP